MYKSVSYDIYILTPSTTCVLSVCDTYKWSLNTYYNNFKHFFKNKDRYYLYYKKTNIFL